MDFVGQIGTEAYVSVNVGSGTVEEAADWLAYMTADQRRPPGHERAANGHPEPYKVKYLGLGNESWGCGGDMRPEYYIDLMKRFARFARNYNPAQQTGRHDAAHRGRADRRRHALYRSGDEGLEPARLELDDRGAVAAQLHAFRNGRLRLPSTEFGEDDYALILQDDAEDGRADRQAFGDHGQI